MNSPLPYYDKELLLRIAAGDEGAFTQVFTPFVDKMAPFLLKMTNDLYITEEVIQETLIKCWLNRDKLPEVNDLDAYVYRVGINEFHRYLRRETAEQMRRTPLSEKTVTLPSYSSELQHFIRQILAGLSPQRQKIYRMSREQGLSIPEIAAALNLSPSTVKHTLMAAISQIREKLIAGGYTLVAVLELLSTYKK